MSARSLRNAVAAVVLTAATAGAGTACGSGDDPPADRGRTPAAEAAATPTPDPEHSGPRTPAPEAPTAEESAPADRGPTVPEPELTPATGSFTQKQKDYLAGRVPRGTDPAAVLEAGQAVCDRIGRTARVDRQAAVSALRAGEIADAEAAVAHLCPQHKPLLEAAGLTGG